MKEKTKKETTPVNLTEVREFAVNLLPQAGKILRTYYSSGDFTSFSKGGVDFATQADVEVDEFLHTEIAKKFPHFQFLTEETAPEDYISLSTVSNLVIIDPLDGTTNFSRRNPNFAISFALAEKGSPRVGVVYVPMTSQIYWAQEDRGGAYLNDQQIHVSNTSDLKKVVLACDWGWDLTKRMNVHRWLGNVLPHVRAVKSMGSAVADLASLAAGNIDVYMHAGLKPWDVAASSLFIQKAGGMVTSPDRGPWDIFNPDMIASNGILHDRILSLINGGEKQ
ncbi:inositol monophosphatase [Candidatus Gottesmanbacteria bacterium]|nr:inositol monophosphatase [Candidatus Gottesmanbacteria bacterium]